MKKEMIGGASALTWNAVLAVIEEGGNVGFTNHDIAAKLGVDYTRVQSLTRIMYEAGALSKAQIGRSKLAVQMFFLPV